MPTIGARGIQSSIMNGQIAEVMLFDGALTQGQIDAEVTGLGIKYSIPTVPEPATMSLLAIGGLLGLRRRRA